MKQDALWYKDAIIYQAHVRTFYDSNGDGIGRATSRDWNRSWNT